MLATVRQAKKKGATKAKSTMLGCLLCRRSLSSFGALHGIKPYESPHNSILWSSETEAAAIEGTLPAKVFDDKFSLDSWLRLERVTGMTPLKLFLLKSNSYRLIRYPSSCGICPVNKLSDMSNNSKGRQ
jgi:hypothetical protein